LGVWTWLKVELEKLATGGVPAKPMLWIRVDEEYEDDIV
jgi:hypothetical protein